MKDASSFRVGNGTNGEASPSTRLNTQYNFSSGSPPYSREPRRLPRIAEVGNGNIGEGSEPDQSLGNATNGSSSHYMPDYRNDTWDNSAFLDLKRGRDNDGNKFSTTIALDTQVALELFFSPPVNILYAWQSVVHFRLFLTTEYGFWTPQSRSYSSFELAKTF